MPSHVEEKNSALKIIGIGNPLGGDDGIGIELLHRLTGMLPANFEFLESPHPGLELLDELTETVPVVFLDAVVDASPIGTVHWLEWSAHSEWSRHERLPSSHGLSVLEIIRLAETMGQLVPPIFFIGVSIKSSRPSDRLSAPLRKMLPEIALQAQQYILQAARKSF